MEGFSKMFVCISSAATQVPLQAGFGLLGAVAELSAAALTEVASPSGPPSAPAWAFEQPVAPSRVAPAAEATRRAAMERGSFVTAGPT